LPRNVEFERAQVWEWTYIDIGLYRIEPWQENLTAPSEIALTDVQQDGRVIEMWNSVREDSCSNAECLRFLELSKSERNIAGSKIDISLKSH
jgi:hypothetical protein